MGGGCRALQALWGGCRGPEGAGLPLEDKSGGLWGVFRPLFLVKAVVLFVQGSSSGHLLLLLTFVSNVLPWAHHWHVMQMQVCPVACCSWPCCTGDLQQQHCSCSSVV